MDAINRAVSADKVVDSKGPTEPAGEPPPSHAELEQAVEAPAEPPPPGIPKVTDKAPPPAPPPSAPQQEPEAVPLDEIESLRNSMMWTGLPVNTAAAMASNGPLVGAQYTMPAVPCGCPGNRIATQASTTSPLSTTISRSEALPAFMFATCPSCQSARPRIPSVLSRVWPCVFRDIWAESVKIVLQR